MKFSDLPAWLRRNRLVNIKFSGTDNSVRPINNLEDINAITSEVISEGHVVYHLPVLDIDVEHMYVESSTTGHAHLVLNVPLHERQYAKLLSVLGEVGIIEQGVLREQWNKHKHTAIRFPGTKKKPTDRSS